MIKISFHIIIQSGSILSTKWKPLNIGMAIFGTSKFGNIIIIHNMRAGVWEFFVCGIGLSVNII